MRSSKALMLTIVIPVYNDKDHLINCLESISRQTVMPDAVIVVDNCSTDGSGEAAKQYPFARVIKEDKQGVVYARDAGFNQVKTEIIGRIDSDTILPKIWVKQVRDFYADGNHINHALTGGCSFYNVRSPRFTSWWQGQVAFRYNRMLLGHYILFGSNMAFTRTQWNEVNGNVCHDLDVHEDLDLAIHLHKKGYQITYSESLRVKVLMRRVRSRRNELWNNIMLWPQTLRKHGKKTWIFGWLGAVFFYVVSPLAPVAEKIAQLSGKPPMSE